MSNNTNLFMLRAFNTHTGQPVIKVYKGGWNARQQIAQFPIINDDVEAAIELAMVAHPGVTGPVNG